jgi:hypothetical protein
VECIEVERQVAALGDRERVAARLGNRAKTRAISSADLM